MSISKREKVLIVIALIFAVFCMYYFFFLQPHTEKMSELNNKITDSDTNLKASQQMQASNAALEKRIAEDMAVVNELSSNITKGNDQPPLLVFLEETVKSNDAVKDTFLFGKPVQSGHLYVLPVTITFTSNYQSLKKILSVFADGKYFIKVTGLFAYLKTENNIPAFEDGNTQDDTQGVTQDDDEQTQPYGMLEVKIMMEVYSLAADIPPDTEYAFDKDYTFGTDIFS